MWSGDTAAPPTHYIVLSVSNLSVGYIYLRLTTDEDHSLKKRCFMPFSFSFRQGWAVTTHLIMDHFMPTSFKPDLGFAANP